MSRREKLAEEAHALVEYLEPQELEVVIRLMNKLNGEGRKEYGPLDVEADPRDFMMEALDEQTDTLCYLLMEMQRLAIHRGRLLRSGQMNLWARAGDHFIDMRCPRKRWVGPGIEKGKWELVKVSVTAWEDQCESSFR